MRHATLNELAMSHVQMSHITHTHTHTHTHSNESYYTRTRTQQTLAQPAITALMSRIHIIQITHMYVCTHTHTQQAAKLDNGLHSSLALPTTTTFNSHIQISHITHVHTRSKQPRWATTYKQHFQKIPLLSACHTCTWVRSPTYPHTASSEAGKPPMGWLQLVGSIKL